MQYIYISPLLIPYLIYRDAISFALSMFQNLVSMGVTVATFFNYPRNHVTYWLEPAYAGLLGMSKPQCIAYRRQRTATQLFFSTIPMLFLQMRLWRSLSVVYGYRDEFLTTVIMIGFMHIFIEMILIMNEMAAYRISFKNYVITLLMGRFNCVPYYNLFVEDESQTTRYELNYNRITSRFCGIVFRHEYYFSPA